MATFKEIQTAVSKRLLDPDNSAVSSSDVADSINSSIKYWKFRRFWFNEVNDSVTLTAENSTLPVTGDFLVSTMKDDGFNIEYSSQRYPLKKLSNSEYDGLFLSNGFGLPRYYARTGDKYEVYPLPDRDYTLNRHYLKEYDALVGDSDTNDFTIYADRLITLWTLADMSAEFRQDDKMEGYYRARADDEYRQLRVMTNKTNSTGRVTLHTTLI